MHKQINLTRIQYAEYCKRGELLIRHYLESAPAIDEIVQLTCEEQGSWSSQARVIGMKNSDGCSAHDLWLNKAD